MNWAHMHLMINHFPVIGLVFGLALLLIAVIKKSDDLKKISLWFFILIALTALPVYFSGEPAEESVEHLSGGAEQVIEQHEKMAMLSLAAVIISGFIAAVGLFLIKRHGKIANMLIMTLLVSLVISSGLMAKTANLGGQIRHTEIRKDFQLHQPDVTIEDKADKDKDEEGDD